VTLSFTDPQKLMKVLRETHSAFKIFTGFAMATLIAWKLTVTSAINIAYAPAITNTHQLKLVL
jgi:hypothetical protein